MSNDKIVNVEVPVARLVEWAQTACWLANPRLVYRPDDPEHLIAEMRRRADELDKAICGIIRRF